MHTCHVLHACSVGKPLHDYLSTRELQLFTTAHEPGSNLALSIALRGALAGLMDYLQVSLCVGVYDLDMSPCIDVSTVHKHTVRNKQKQTPSLCTDVR